MRSVNELICLRMGPKAGQSASGMCSTAFLWKLLAGHLGDLAPNDLAAPLTHGSQAACGNQPAPHASGLRPCEPGSPRPGAGADRAASDQGVPGELGSHHLSHLSYTCWRRWASACEGSPQEPRGHIPLALG